MDRRGRSLLALGLAVALMGIGWWWWQGQEVGSYKDSGVSSVGAQRELQSLGESQAPEFTPAEPEPDSAGEPTHKQRNPDPASPPERVFDHSPRDPIETGACELLLRLFDRETGDPVESDVFLWRIDAPGNDNWSEGDQLQTRESIPKEGFTFGKLPEGDYRLVCVAERFDAEDHGVFRVEGPETRVDLDLLLPRPQSVFVTIYTIDGGTVRKATIANRGFTPGKRPVDRPEWLRARELKGRLDEPGAFGLGGGGAGAVIRKSLSTTKDGRFLLGKIKEDRRSTLARYFFDVSPEGLSTTHVQVDAANLGEQNYVSVAIDPRYVLRRLRQPNGAQVDGRVSERVDIVASALYCGDRDPAELWSRVEIKVKVADPRFQTYRFSFRLEEGDLPDEFLRLR